ncbi:hypothetical protein QTO34_012106 [Cnephaeus nilssonii]|uniref:Uncharacterized protein n=1 Tax=Cnephaeus nilssonii TaxID=3371016 RepID=A0AA40HC63_CNENI|nr:hypothetical protein QTO34_012106 [Eptesicus nilssonii]
MEQKSTVSCEATGKGYLTVHMPNPRPLRVDFHWVPGSDPGTLDGSPWLLHRFLAQLGGCMSFRFEHYQDNLSCVCKILRAPDRPRLGDLEEVIQNLNSFAEYHPAALPLVPTSSQPPVAPQLPVVRQYLARFSEALALNMGATLRPVPDILATLAISSSDSELKNPLPQQQLAKESSPGPTEPPACPLLRVAPVLFWWGQPPPSQHRWSPNLSLCFQNLPNPPAQQPDPAHPAGPEPQKIGEVGGPQGAVDTPETPRATFFSCSPPCSPGFCTFQAGAAVLLVMKWPM